MLVSRISGPLQRRQQERPRQPANHPHSAMRQTTRPSRLPFIPVREGQRGERRQLGRVDADRHQRGGDALRQQDRGRDDAEAHPSIPFTSIAKNPTAANSMKRSKKVTSARQRQGGKLSQAGAFSTGNPRGVRDVDPRCRKGWILFSHRDVSKDGTEQGLRRAIRPQRSSTITTPLIALIAPLICGVTGNPARQ